MNINFLNPVEVEKFVLVELVSQQDRLDHILVIAKKVKETCLQIIKLHKNIVIDSKLAICAALLHDIGYADNINITGFHPIDGSNFLTKLGYSTLAELIIGHSCSPEEAELKGLQKITPSNALEAKLISYWDMRVMQGGRIVTYDQRLNDIIKRYGKDSIIGKANLQAKERLIKEFNEIELLLK